MTQRVVQQAWRWWKTNWKLTNNTNGWKSSVTVQHLITTAVQPAFTKLLWTESVLTAGLHHWQTCNCACFARMEQSHQWSHLCWSSRCLLWKPSIVQSQCYHLVVKAWICSYQQLKYLPWFLLDVIVNVNVCGSLMICDVLKWFKCI